MKVEFNKDEKIVKMIQEGLKAKDGYCPCRLDKTSDTKCICKEFREQEIGQCHCGLYEKYYKEEA